MSEKKPSAVFNKNSEERRRKRTKTLFVAFLALLAILAACIAFMRKPGVQIGDVSVSGARSLDPEAVRSAALEFVRGSYLGVIPKTNALLFSKSGMRKFLLEKIPSLSDATVEFSARNLVSVTVTEKKPDSVWCRADECYFIDGTGMIYEESPRFSDGVFVAFTGSSVPVDTTPLRERFVPASLFSSLHAAIDAMAGYPFSVVGVDLQESGDVAIRVDSVKGIPVNPRAQILTTRDVTGKDIAGSMDLLFGNPEFKAALSLRGADLQYLDFRFPGKIFYKFNGAPLTP